MSTTWLEPRNPLDPSLKQLLGDLDELLGARNVQYLLTGGMAREILLYYGYGCVTGRVTTDVDFGVGVSSWDAFEELRQALASSGKFTPHPKLAQRMTHKAVKTGLETKVDLVPFGAIAGPGGELKWPPDGSVVMSVLGYEQAMKTMVRLRLDEGRWAPLASGQGLACMKLVAWNDRGEARLGKDAVDFIELLHQYNHVLSDVELYDEHPEVMPLYNFDVEPTAAFILGKQVASIAEGPLMGVMKEAMSEASRRRMVDYFLRQQSAVESEARNDRAMALLEAFNRGLESGGPQE